jgi:hypothetical protein
VFTPTDTANYNTASKDVTINVLKGTPVIAWNNPADMIYGTALSATQLNATANVPGTFVYTPAVGTVLNISTQPQTLHVAFTPTDTTNYNMASKEVTINVRYASSGLCLGEAGHAILQPINADGTSVFKKGSTVPAKFRVCDVNGVSVGSSGVVTKFTLIQTLNGTATDIDEQIYSTTPDTAFRWSSTDQQWLFNISTKNLTANTTYLYRITLNDGTFFDFKYGLK